MPDARLVVPGPRHLRVPAPRSTARSTWRRSTSACGPTFKTGRGLLVEAFLLDFDGDIYGHELRLDFLERLRGEKRFDSVEALVEQMAATSSETAPASRT